MNRTIKICLPLVTVLVCLAVAELVIHFYYPQSLSLSYKTRDGLRILRPHHTSVYRSVERSVKIQINSQGMRDREHSFNKPRNTKRILLLGDSFMEALQVKYESSFPRLLEDNLRRESDFPVEVINASISGWGTDQELTYLTRYGYKFQPDLILVAMTLTNDVYDNLGEEFHTLDGGGLSSKPELLIPFWEYKFWQLRSFLGSRLHLYQLVRFAWHARALRTQGEQLAAQMVDQIRNRPSERTEKGWRLTFALLKAIQSTGVRIGAGTAVILIPLSIQLSPEQFANYIEVHSLPREAVCLGRPQQLMKEFGRNQHLEVIDLLPGFRDWQEKSKESILLERDGHWNEAGHRVAASIVSQAISSWVR